MAPGAIQRSLGSLQDISKRRSFSSIALASLVVLILVLMDVQNLRLQALERRSLNGTAITSVQGQVFGIGGFASSSQRTLDGTTGLLSSYLRCSSCHSPPPCGPSFASIPLLSLRLPSASPTANAVFGVFSASRSISSSDFDGLLPCDSSMPSRPRTFHLTLLVASIPHLAGLATSVITSFTRAFPIVARRAISESLAPYVMHSEMRDLVPPYAPTPLDFGGNDTRRLRATCASFADNDSTAPTLSPPASAPLIVGGSTATIRRVGLSTLSSRSTSPATTMRTSHARGDDARSAPHPYSQRDCLCDVRSQSFCGNASGATGWSGAWRACAAGMGAAAVPLYVCGDGVGEGAVDWWGVGGGHSLRSVVAHDARTPFSESLSPDSDARSCHVSATYIRSSCPRAARQCRTFLPRPHSTRLSVPRLPRRHPPPSPPLRL
ncbi:hypothetical protein B0H19DRAFT_190165 [Mycena capillaripes]|nr:hypothetical protein B0H19DRAFT_190165 [Mycena capillaripes]